ncbi:MAG: DUF4388 domain-containing protein [Myxococcales bacterium]|nr:DUF4388 domain-containing protein [Myxococcales bacterium]
MLLGATSRVRVLYFGNSISRQEALSFGAHEFLTPPAFIRDVVTLSKLMATPMERRTQSISGELSDHFGLFYLVRALGMVKYTGVLTLLRGLRRGELRFYEGEVTSGQMRSLHGIAALHQSLLWTHARFDLRDEQTVYRRQIPLERAELLRDCERFLHEIRSVAGGLSPSAVLDRHHEKDVSTLPSQVLAVLELFDGTCSVADVIEDSPYRVFETFRITCRLAELGFIHRASNDVPKHLMHTALAIEEWLVSGSVASESASEESVPPGPAKGQPASPPRKKGKKQRGRRRSSDSVPPPLAAVSPNEQSWSDLLPSVQAKADLAQVVPSTDAAGVISTRPSSRASRVGGTEPPPLPERERLEEKSGVASLANIFVDEALGAEMVASEDPRTLYEREISDGAAGRGRANDSWDEDTAPAMPSSIASASHIDAEEDAVTDTEARAVVAQTAKDAVTAIAAISDAASANPAVFQAPDPKSKKRADSKSDRDAQNVADLASAAEDAGTKASYFSIEEEAFFDRGHAEAKEVPVVSDSFDFEDLDEDYEIPKTFWQRFLSNPDMKHRKKKKN